MIAPRLRAILSMMTADSREYVGLHDLDGVLQDLSIAGVRRGLADLGGPRYSNSYDERLVAAFEDAMRFTYGRLEEHRRSPLAHIGNLDVSCYARTYAPEAERAEARLRHLAGWPDAIDGAVAALDSVPAPVATALLGAARGLSGGIDREEGPEAAAALDALPRLVAHLEGAAEHGDPDASLGSEVLTAMLSTAEAMPVDLARLSARADAERNRLVAMLTEACERLQPGIAVPDVVASLLRDHPDAGGVLDEARQQIEEATAFTYARDLLPELGGECLVGPAPPSRSWAMAMMSWAAPFEADAPSWYYVTPPDPSWPEAEQEEWLTVFSRTTLPAITVHEVTPGHYAHARMLRRVDSDPRRSLLSGAFVEGWAHYAEELFVEEGFRADDPRYAAGVAIEALIRVTRLAVSIGMHTGSMDVEEATARFERDAYQQGPAARSEANRATFDPTYGRYTWGKLEILALRDEARARWGARYSHRRFHEALLGLGAPPLGMIGAILDDSE